MVSLHVVGQRTHDGHRVLRMNALRDTELYEAILLRLMEGTEFTRDEAIITLTMVAEACDHFGVTLVRDRIRLQDNPTVYRRVEEVIHGGERTE